MSIEAKEIRFVFKNIFYNSFTALSCAFPVDLFTVVFLSCDTLVYLYVFFQRNVKRRFFFFWSKAEDIGRWKEENLSVSCRSCLPRLFSC